MIMIKRILNKEDVFGVVKIPEDEQKVLHKENIFVEIKIVFFYNSGFEYFIASGRK
jgi:hypothetical protein